MVTIKRHRHFQESSRLNLVYFVKVLNSKLHTRRGHDEVANKQNSENLTKTLKIRKSQIQKGGRQRREIEMPPSPEQQKFYLHHIPFLSDKKNKFYHVGVFCKEKDSSKGQNS